MYMNEHSLINIFFETLSAGRLAELSKLVRVHNDAILNSVVLSYYTGKFYSSTGNAAAAQQAFERSISLNKYFSPPYFDLGNMYMQQGKFENAERLLLQIFNKPTMRGSLAGSTLAFNLSDSLRICSLLGPGYIKRKQGSKLQKLYDAVLGKLAVQLETTSDVGTFTMSLQCWKYMHRDLAVAAMQTDPEEALLIYKKGLHHKSKLDAVSILGEEVCAEMDRPLLQGCIVASHYTLERPGPNTFGKNVDDVFRPTLLDMPFGQEESRTVSCPTEHRKTRIGYFSPDFNKNAVGLFLTPFLKHFDHDVFEVYCYYDNRHADQYTHMFKSFPYVHWNDVSHLENDKVFSLIRHSHKIDILVDLIGHGIGNRMELMAMRPADTIINYLGFPGSTGMTTVSHRITDVVCDPVGPLTDERHTEQLVRFPRTFLCYQLFENIRLPQIRSRIADGMLYLGVMNRAPKCHPFVRGVWKRILEAKENCILCIKLDQHQEEKEARLMFADFPNERLKFIKFCETLEEYLDQFNNIDVCLDTYPYSGTTTTCSSLIMGVPVVTHYDPSEPHVSNVSTSILRATAECAEDMQVAGTLQLGVCKNWNEYVRVGSSGCRLERASENLGDGHRKAVRSAFLECMEPTRYMREYEELLGTVRRT